jgi:hypothetical protein
MDKKFTKIMLPMLKLDTNNGLQYSQEKLITLACITLPKDRHYQVWFHLVEQFCG